MTRRLAIIDGDVLIYQAAGASESIFDWGEDLWSIAADFREAVGRFKHLVDEAVQESLCDGYVVCVSDAKNFRKDLYPEYKSHRKNRKPLVYRKLLDWAITNYGAIQFPSLEGDDVMGILATDKAYLAGQDPCLITIDKDLGGIPGLHYNPHKKKEVWSVSQEEADFCHLSQTISGDATDGYPGVPGLGKVRADRLLTEKGATWETVLGAYTKAGLPESYALLMARLAKILDSSLWDAENRKWKMWTPKLETVTQ